MAMTMGGNASAARHRLRSRRQRRRGRNRWLVWLVWLVAPVVLGYGATALIARDAAAPPPVGQSSGQGDRPDGHQSDAAVLDPQRPPPGAAAASPTAVERPAAASSQEVFEFYRLLPNAEVVIPEAELRSVDAPPSSAPSPSADAPVASRPAVAAAVDGWQVAAFRHYAPADALRAQLALSGLTATVRTRVDAQGRTWHRVQLGPYPDRAELAAVRDRLRAMGMTALPLPR